jgi:hypothetical protein
MSLVDLQLWVFKLFQLHPETQDLAIKGFIKDFSVDCPFMYAYSDSESCPDYSWDYWEWDGLIFKTPKCWSVFARKIRQRKGREMFLLYVDSSEIKHYDVLLKAVDDNYSQLATVLLPGQKCLSDYSTTDFFWVLSRFVKDLSMTIGQIAAYISESCASGQISLPEAWRARQKALERQFGTFYESHNYVPRILKNIVDDGFVDIKDTEVAGCEDFRVLHHIFWAFTPCIQAFLHCRPVLSIKGIPLRGKYEGVLLTAVALDANDCLIPVACAVIGGETKESWLWFLGNVKRAVVKGRSGVCIVHDYKKDLINAIDDIRGNPQQPHPWSDVQNRWSMQHLAENFLVYFDDQNLMMMFKRLCQQKQKRKFLDIWKELDELTLKYTLEKEGGAGGSVEKTQQEFVGHGEMDIEAERPCNQLGSVEDGEEGDHAFNSSNRKITNFSDWIRLKPMENWSLLHDKNGARYGIMDTDIADAFKGTTCLPLCQIVEVAFWRLVRYFENRSAAADKAMSNPLMNFPECVQDEMDSKMQKARKHQVICTENRESTISCGKEVKSFMVRSGEEHVMVRLTSEYTHGTDKSRKCIVRRTAECSCNKPQLLRKPCSHVVAVCCQTGVSAATYMSQYYSLRNLVKTWRGKFVVSPMTLRSYKVEPFDFEYAFGYPIPVFTFPDLTPTWIPDKKLECALPSFLTTDCVQTVMEDEQQCSTKTRSAADN